MKIGLLEDNHAIRDYMTEALERAGHRVYPHISGDSLVERLFLDHDIHAPLPYNLVIVDLLLPGTLSSVAVIGYIQRTLSAETLPLIVISAASDSQLEQLGTRFPGVRALRKPFAMKALLQLIEASHVSDTASSGSEPFLLPTQDA